MKVFLTYPPVEKVYAWEGPAFVARIAGLFEASRDRRGHQLVQSAEQADVILYLEPNCWKDRDYAELMLREENILSFPQKCFAYGYADFFIGFLPGLYVCVTQEHAPDGRFGSWNYLLGLPNAFVEKMTEEREGRKPSLLFSFRGSKSAPVRGPVLDNAAAWSGFARITEIDGKHFHNVPEQQQRGYVDEILDSHFVLCPRGLGCSSHRLFETMALGRVPVILSDAWVEPLGPAWDEFSVRVPEKDASRLPEILRPLQDQAAAMGRRARQEWETWFAPDVVVPRFFDRLEALMGAQPKTPPDFAALWRSWSFYQPYGLAPHQKLWKNVRSGEVFKKIARRAGLAKK
jgi:hypothetical protein